MTTRIFLWIEPMVMNHQKCSNEKLYFNCVVDGDYSKLEPRELEDVIEGKIMSHIMDFADIETNWDYGVVSAMLSKKAKSHIIADVEMVDSPEEVAEAKRKAEQDKLAATEKKKIDRQIAKVVKSNKPIALTKTDVKIQDDGTFAVSLPLLGMSDKIDFPKIWAGLEKDFIGKIKKGDTVVMEDDNGNKLFEIIGGDFLNVGIADLMIYDPQKNPNPAENTMFGRGKGLKGGAFLRDDGSIDVGDIDRTFYMRIYTNNLVKASLKLNKSLTEIAQIKLLNK